MMVLVTGATGNVGSNVVRELRGLAVPVRAFVRDAERARGVLGDDVPLAVGDFTDASSVRAAVDGVQRVFLASADGPDKVLHETVVVDAARSAGVELVVKCSTIGAEVGSALPPFDWHGRIEAHLARSGVPAVTLRSCFFMTNLLASAEQIAEGTLVAPAGDGRIAMIDPRDTAAVAARILADPGHAGREYVLTGPESLRFEDLASVLTAVTGRHVEYVDVPDEAARAAFVAAGLPAWLVAHLSALFPLVRANALAETTGTVRALTGRAPRTFAEFATDVAHVFAGPVGAEHR